MPTPDYAPPALERQGPLAGPLLDASGRGSFLIDRDSILYSSAFRRLAGKTQVVASSELGDYHNRLTHSIKVAQLGRAIASRLQPDGPDPDLVDAACLAHDIGHPPFGHAGESALAEAVYRLRCAESGRPARPREADDHVAVDGFEGNAQNLRVLAFLSSHAVNRPSGLHLTRATLAAATKYPWTRAHTGYARKKWGAYDAEGDLLEWILEPRTSGHPVRPVEADLMDWCDDVTYAVHDMEDFFRQGLIPMERIFHFSVSAGHPYAPRDENEEVARFLDYVESSWDADRDDGPFDRQQAVLTLHNLNDLVSVREAYRPLHSIKSALHTTRNDLISYFADGVTITGDPPRGYTGTLVIPDGCRFACNLLKKLIWFYVIKRPSFAAQQRGQQRVVADLTNWYAEDPERLLPDDRAEELAMHGDPVRAVADHIATLSEGHALALHRRLSGHELGSITDAV